MARRKLERGPKAEPLIKDEALEREGKLLSDLNESLHALSQPMTVLLCALEYGGNAGSEAEVHQMLKLSQEACEQLREITAAMRSTLREAIGKRAASGADVVFKR